MKLKINRTISSRLLPPLLESQLKSYCWFLEKGFISELNKFIKISNPSKTLEVSFIKESYKIKKPIHSLDRSKKKIIHIISKFE